MLERRGCLPPSVGELQEEGAASLSHPSRPRGPTDPQAGARSPSVPRFVAARPPRLWRPHTAGAHPLPPVRSWLPRPSRSPPRPRQHGPDTADGPAGGKFPPRKEEGRDGAGRGGGGGEEKGRQRKGRGGVERPAGVPRRKRLGRLVPGTRPQVTNNNNNNNDNDEDGVLPRCQAMG